MGRKNNKLTIHAIDDDPNDQYTVDVLLADVSKSMDWIRWSAEDLDKTETAVFSFTDNIGPAFFVLDNTNTPICSVSVQGGNGKPVDTQLNSGYDNNNGNVVIDLHVTVGKPNEAELRILRQMAKLRRRLRRLEHQGGVKGNGDGGGDPQIIVGD